MTLQHFREVLVRFRSLTSAVVAAALLAGCGPGDTATDVATQAAPSPAPTSLGELLVQAGQHHSSGRFEAALSVDGVAELPAGLGVRMAGATTGPGGASTVTFDVSDLATAIAVLASDEDAPPPFVLDLLRHPVQMTTVDETVWVRSEALAGLFGGDPGWIELAPDALGALGPAMAGVSPTPSTPAAPTDPAELLALLGPIDQPLEELGPDTVRGEATTRYRTTIDLGEVLSNLMGFAAAPGLVVDPDERMPLVVEVWVDGDGALRRADLRADIDEPGEDLITIAFTLELFDLGAEIQVTPPPADQVTPVGELDLGALAALME